jgi:hypothetical protein
VSRKLSQDEVLDARTALEEHTAALQPKHADTTKANDWTQCEGLTTMPKFDLAARRAEAHETLRLATAAKQVQ